MMTDRFRFDRELSVHSPAGCQLYLELSSYTCDRDPLRPAWLAMVPNERWADPNVSLTPKLY